MISKSQKVSYSASSGLCECGSRHECWLKLDWCIKYGTSPFFLIKTFKTSNKSVDKTTNIEISHSKKLIEGIGFAGFLKLC